MESAIRELEAQEGKRLIDLRRRYNASILRGGVKVTSKTTRVSEEVSVEKQYGRYCGYERHNTLLKTLPFIEASHCGNYVFISYGKEIRIYYIGKGKHKGKHIIRLVRIFEVKDYDITCLAVSSDGSFAVGTAGNTVEVFRRVPRNYRPLTDVDIEKNILSLYKWNIRNPTSKRRTGIQCLAFDSTGKYLASGDRDKNVDVWNLSNGSHHFNLKAHTNDALSVAFSPDGILASAGLDKRLILWDINLTNRNIKGKEIIGPDPDFHYSASIKKAENRSAVRCVCFSPDGKYLASSLLDGTVKLYKVGLGWNKTELVWSKGFGRTSGNCYGKISFSPTGEYIALSGDRYNTLDIGNTETGKIIHTYNDTRIGVFTGRFYNHHEDRWVSSRCDKIKPQLTEQKPTLMFLAVIHYNPFKKGRKKLKKQFNIKIKKKLLRIGKKESSSSSSSGISASASAKRSLSVSPKPSLKRIRSETSNNPILIMDESSVSGAVARDDDGEDTDDEDIVFPKRKAKTYSPLDAQDEVLESATNDEDRKFIEANQVERDLRGKAEQKMSTQTTIDNIVDVISDSDEEELADTDIQSDYSDYSDTDIQSNYSDYSDRDDDDDAKQSPAELYASYIEAENVDALSSIPVEYITRDLIESAIRKNNSMILGLLLRKIGPAT